MNPQTPHIKDSEQRVLNKSFDEVYQVLAVEMLGENNASLKRVQTDSSGRLVMSPTSSSDILGGYTQSRVDLDGDPLYIGYENATHTIIKRVNLSSNEVKYYKTSGTTAAIWAGRAGYTYVEANVLY